MNQMVYLRDLDYREESALRFRLTYRGPLRATQGEPREGQRIPLADHKQEIRKTFHRQLKRLWADTNFLSETSITPSALAKLNQPISDLSWDLGTIGETKSQLVDIIAGQYHINGYHFVPLVREDMAVSCGLEVLFLRRDNPGSVLYAGDIDNRMKTLIDALRIPKMAKELGKYTSPADDEEPFFVLLEEDKLVTAFSVESDTLLNYGTGVGTELRGGDLSEVNLTISVTIKPYNVTLFNLNFA